TPPRNSKVPASVWPASGASSSATEDASGPKPYANRELPSTSRYRFRDGPPPKLAKKGASWNGGSPSAAVCRGAPPQTGWERLGCSAIRWVLVVRKQAQFRLGAIEPHVQRRCVGINEMERAIGHDVRAERQPVHEVGRAFNAEAKPVRRR